MLPIEIAGYLAAALVFSTFYMQTMIPLRYVAIASNLAFITYGFLEGLYPVLILHILLLPLNAFRLVQMKKLVKQVSQAAEGNLSMEWLTPFATRKHLAKGATLFQRGDEADDLYYIVKGSVRLVDFDRTVGAGEMIGEVGIFSPHQERTSTAVCETDTEFLTIPGNKVIQLYYQNPQFGFYLIQLIIRRFIQLQSTPHGTADGGPGPPR